MMKVKDVMKILEKANPEADVALYYESGIRGNCDDVWVSANGYVVIADQPIQEDKEKSIKVKHSEWD